MDERDAQQDFQRVLAVERRQKSRPTAVIALLIPLHVVELLERALGLFKEEIAVEGAAGREV